MKWSSVGKRPSTKNAVSGFIYIWTFTGPVETSLTGDPEAIIPLTLTQEMIQSMGAGHLLMILVSQ